MMFNISSSKRWFARWTNDHYGAVPPITGYCVLGEKTVLLYRFGVIAESAATESLSVYVFSFVGIGTV